MQPRERAPGLWLTAVLLLASAWVAVLASLTRVPSGAPRAPRTIEDDLRAFYGEDHEEVIALAIERRGSTRGT